MAISDFTIFADNDFTISVAIRDANGGAVSIVSPVGKFLVMDEAQTTALVTRDSGSSQNVRIYQTGGQWFLDCDVLSADTSGLTPGRFYYECRIDSGGKKATVRAGFFLLSATFLRP